MLDSFGTSLTRLSEDTVVSLQSWLRGLASTRAVPALPGVSAAAMRSPAIGSKELDDFYDALLSIATEQDPTRPCALQRNLPAGAGDSVTVCDVAQALGLTLLPLAYCDISPADGKGWPPPGVEFMAHVMARRSAPGGPRRGRDTTPKLEPGSPVWLCNFTCGPGHGEIPWFRVPALMHDKGGVSWRRGDVKLRNNAAVSPQPSVAAARAGFLASVLVARRARVLGRRIAGGVLLGASLQHCQVLSGEPRLCLAGAQEEDRDGDGSDGFDIVHALHERDVLQIETRRADVAALLTHGLLQRVPPPEVASSKDDDEDEDDDDSGFHGEDDDDTKPRSKAARRRAALRLEVAPFVAAFVELLDCKLLATPVNKGGRTPLQCVPEASAAAEASATLFRDFSAARALAPS